MIPDFTIKYPYIKVNTYDEFESTVTMYSGNSFQLIGKHILCPVCDKEIIIFPPQANKTTSHETVEISNYCSSCAVQIMMDAKEQIYKLSIDINSISISTDFRTITIISPHKTKSLNYNNLNQFKTLVKTHKLFL